MGVPVQIGAGGIEKVIEVDLTDSESKMLDESVSHVRELVDASEKASLRLRRTSLGVR